MHSVRGQSRASSVLACYLMRKYKWSLLKTLEFLNSRRPDLEIRVSFIQQLSDYEARLFSQQAKPTKKWSELDKDARYLESEELLLRNTFLNSKTTPNALIQFQQLPFPQQRPKEQIKWADK